MTTQWSVVSQRETTILDPGGRFTKVIAVSFRTSGGHVGSVDVPVAVYNQQTVADMIQPYADTLDAVGGM